MVIACQLIFNLFLSKVYYIGLQVKLRKLTTSNQCLTYGDHCFGLQVKLEGDINRGVAFYKKALHYNWHYADAMYNLGVAYGEMLKFDMVCLGQACLYFTHTLHVQGFSLVFQGILSKIKAKDQSDVFSLGFLILN